MFAPMNSQYGGLLNQEEMTGARNNMLLNLGLGLLSQSGPSPHKIGLGQAIGTAGMQAMNSQQGYINNLTQNRLMKSKFDEMEKQKQREEEFRGLLGSPMNAPGRGSPVTGGGLLGGQMQMPEFYGRVAALGGDYTGMGLKGLGDLNSVNQGRGDYYSPVQTAGGIMAFDHRKGVVVNPTTLKPVNTPVVGSASDINLQGDLSRSKSFGEEVGKHDVTSTVKKPQQAKDTLALLSEAEKIIPQSTGSLGGTGVDIAAGSVGVATGGAKANARLKVIQAGLMTNMPRMEGPQSDRDVLLYREAAGQIGDPKVPNDIKMAALETIKGINQRYADKAKPTWGGRPAQTKTTWEDDQYMYRKLPDGTVQRKKK